MATVQIPIEADARICTNGFCDTDNFGNHNLATNETYEWRIILRPDLSSIPESADIESVKFYMYQEGGSDSSVVESIYRLRREFVENEVTGQRASSGVNWTTDGAESTASDRYAALAGSLTFNNSRGWESCDIDVTEFEALLTTNTGFLIKRTTGSAGDKTFTSSEGVTAGLDYAPYFEVTYVSSASQQIIII